MKMPESQGQELKVATLEDRVDTLLGEMETLRSWRQTESQDAVDDVKRVRRTAHVAIGLVCGLFVALLALCGCFLIAQMKLLGRIDALREEALALHKSVAVLESKAQSKPVRNRPPTQQRPAEENR